ncbi:hypothetical protein INT48_006117 [Thamnidium elegans]|uniref:RxLR effector protein n=1 Tax=Thamnidium elegans TaxID=101142 RepID=A0A8H7SXA8_9FUNG|nr:hypothetical protein INT48_006117 [Thamnidium elegans]
MYASTLFVLTFVCLMFGAANSAVIPNKNVDSNVIRISKSYSPQGAALVKRNNELLAQSDDGVLGHLGGRLGRTVSPALQNTDEGVNGHPRQ